MGQDRPRERQDIVFLLGNPADTVHSVKVRFFSSNTRCISFKISLYSILLTYSSVNGVYEIYPFFYLFFLVGVPILRKGAEPSETEFSAMEEVCVQQVKN